MEGDRFFGFLAAGATAPWLPNSDAQNVVVLRAAAVAAGQFVKGGYETVYDGVLGPWHLDAFVAASGLESFHYAVLLPPEDECVRRVTIRKGHGFKDVAATRQMHREFVNAAVARHVLSNPPDGIDDVVELVCARRQDGSLRYTP